MDAYGAGTNGNGGGASLNGAGPELTDAVTRARQVSRVVNNSVWGE